MVLESAMIHTVLVKSATGRSVSGDPSYGTTRSVPCHHCRRARVAISPSGVVRTQSDEVVTNSEIFYEDQIWLPGETEAADQPHRPISIDSSVIGGVRSWVVSL